MQKDYASQDFLKEIKAEHEIEVGEVGKEDDEYPDADAKAKDERLEREWDAANVARMDEERFRERDAANAVHVIDTALGLFVK